MSTELTTTRNPRLRRCVNQMVQSQNKALDQVVDVRKLETMLQELDKIHTEQKELAARDTQLRASIWEAMKLEKKKLFASDTVVAKIEPEKKNGKNVVDIKALKAKVTEDQFLLCVDVAMGKVKTILAAAELAAITTHVPGGVGEDKLVIEFMSDKKGK